MILFPDSNNKLDYYMFRVMGESEERLGLFSAMTAFWQLTLHKVGPGLQPPNDLTLLGAVHPSVLAVPHVGRTGFIWPREEAAN